MTFTSVPTNAEAARQRVGRPPGRKTSAGPKLRERSERALELEAMRERIRHLQRRVRDGSLAWTPGLERQAQALAMRTRDLWFALQAARPKGGPRRA